MNSDDRTRRSVVGRTQGAAAIIIPTYNRPRQLAQCLADLDRLDAAPWPIIVVDDGSAQPLDAVCAPYANVTLIRQDNAGPGAARNAGARAAETFDKLLFIDDDCRPRPDWASKLVAAQGDTPGRLVGGRVTNALPDNPFSAASQSLLTFLYDYYQAHGSEMKFFTTNNMCVRRTDFLAAGGFDAGFAFASEDRDFSLRWAARGGELTYREDAVVEHAHDLSFASFWKQHSSYGRGARKLHLTLDERTEARPRPEGLGFYFGMLTQPFRGGGRQPFAEAFLVGLSQVAMLTGYASAIRDERKTGR